jgi:hypothetical protein
MELRDRGGGTDPSGPPRSSSEPGLLPPRNGRHRTPGQFRSPSGTPVEVRPRDRGRRGKLRSGSCAGGHTADPGARRPVVVSPVGAGPSGLRLFDVFESVARVFLKFGDVRRRELGSAGSATNGRRVGGCHAAGMWVRYIRPQPPTMGAPEPDLGRLSYPVSRSTDEGTPAPGAPVAGRRRSTGARAPRRPLPLPPPGNRPDATFR